MGNSGLAMGVSMMTGGVGMMLKRAFTGKKTRVFRGFIDGEQIAKLKADAQSRGSVSFVSTNDIITSAFSKASRAHTCAMAVNVRERMSGLTESLAGNYVKGMMFDPTHSATPDRVRLALQHPRFHCCDRSPKMFSRFALITNWSSFSKAIRIPDCVEQLHQPLMFVPEELKFMPMDAMIVFRAGAQRLGALWITPRGGSEKDVLGDMPFALDTVDCSEI